MSHEPELAGPQNASAQVRRGVVLIVEDEPTIAEVVARYLARAGYDTHIASEGTAALDAIRARRPDLVVLDVMLPGIDGIEIMRRLRASGGPEIAIVLLSARRSESDRIAGLEAGADDYVVKPFAPAELVARVNAVLRRVSTRRDGTERLEFGDLVIDIGQHRVLCNGSEVSLTLREFDLLAHLAGHAGRTFSRDELMRGVWKFSFYTDTATVTVHIRRLRAKLAIDPDAAARIETVWGVGYRFRA